MLLPPPSQCFTHSKKSAIVAAVWSQVCWINRVNSDCYCFFLVTWPLLSALLNFKALSLFLCEERLVSSPLSISLSNFSSINHFSASISLMTFTAQKFNSFLNVINKNKINTWNWCLESLLYTLAKSLRRNNKHQFFGNCNQFDSWWNTPEIR